MYLYVLFYLVFLIHVDKVRSILFNIFSVTICTTVIVKEKNKISGHTFVLILFLMC